MRLYTPISGWKRGMGWITASSQVPNRCSHTPSPPRPRRMEHWVTSTVYFTKDIPYIYILRFPKSWGTPKSSSHLTILGLKPVVLEIPHSPCIHIELNNLIISFDWTTQVPHWNAHPSMKRIGKKPGGAPQQLNQCGDHIMNVLIHTYGTSTPSTCWFWKSFWACWSRATDLYCRHLFTGQAQGSKLPFDGKQIQSLSVWIIWVGK